jgi:hypothetical protein
MVYVPRFPRRSFPAFPGKRIETVNLIWSIAIAFPVSTLHYYNCRNELQDYCPCHATRMVQLVGAAVVNVFVAFGFVVLMMQYTRFGFRLFVPTIASTWIIDLFFKQPVTLLIWFWFWGSQSGDTCSKLREVLPMIGAVAVVILIPTAYIFTSLPIGDDRYWDGLFADDGGTS